MRKQFSTRSGIEDGSLGIGWKISIGGKIREPLKVFYKE
jgi:hypothetical protein